MVMAAALRLELGVTVVAMVGAGVAVATVDAGGVADALGEDPQPATSNTAPAARMARRFSTRRLATNMGNTSTLILAPAPPSGSGLATKAKPEGNWAE